jgi:hypothetical protein
MVASIHGYAFHRYDPVNACPSWCDAIDYLPLPSLHDENTFATKCHDSHAGNAPIVSECAFHGERI